MATLEDYRPADYAVIGAAGLAAVFALFGAWFTIPWRRRSRTAKGTREFNPLWRGRAALELLCALWVLVQMLRLTSLWGASSVVFGGGVTAWTSSGWMCRAYLAASLGVLQPLCSLTTLLLIATAVSRKFGPDPQQRPAARVACLAVGLAAPVAAVQGLFAFMSLFLRYQGQPPEAQPRSALGIFFATYWRGDAQQCGGSGGGSGGGGGCAACTFPAASVIAHAAFTAAYVGALALLSSRTAAAALNQHLRRRVRVFQALESALAIAGAAALGASQAAGPFSWINQGCWLGYVASLVGTTALVSWELVVWPEWDLRRASRLLVQWEDSGALRGLGPSSESPSGLIKAHNRSAEAEAAVAASLSLAAATRTASVGAAG